MDTKGKFIVFEGIDGSGKSTQMSMLSAYLTGRGVPCERTHEPTASPIGALLRDCMSGKTETCERAIAAMFAADRLDHIQNPKYGMLAKLAAGTTVLCDRYYFSSFAYNGGIVPSEWVEELNRPAMELLRPDLVIFLDLLPEESMKRVSRRGGRERYETLERQTITRARFFEAFRKFGETENVAVIKSEEEIERTQAHIVAAVDALFGF